METKPKPKGLNDRPTRSGVRHELSVVRGWLRDAREDYKRHMKGAKDKAITKASVSRDLCKADECHDRILDLQNTEHQLKVLLIELEQGVV